MITEDKIENNKKLFIQLMHELDDRFGVDAVNSLVNMLESTDFFIAPASIYYHCAYRGGLCAHSLNVYDNLINLVAMKGYNYGKESLITVALLHDVSKLNFFEEYAKNVKHYSDNGSKRDEFGRFDWVAEKAYKAKEFPNRFVLGTHEMNSVFIISKYFDLNAEETASILNCLGEYGKSENYEITQIFNSYPLACLLHVADMMASNLDEGIEVGQ